MTEHAGNIRTFLAAVTVALSCQAYSSPVGAPVRIIFDTDMYTDFDDVGALSVLHALADAGECEILGTVVSSRGAPSAGMVEILNAYYGRGDLPIGAPRGIGMGPGNDHLEKNLESQRSYRMYLDMVKARPALRYGVGGVCPDANEVYRHLLANAPDGGVTIVTVGFTTNLRRLLETRPDEVSSLDGKALVARKVRAWYAMACRFPQGFEYNSGADCESSRIVFRDWPTPVYFLDFCYGVDVYCGRPVAALTDAENPVRDVFRRALREYHEEERGHPSWDEVTVLAAVRGWRSHFGVERGRFEMTDDKGTDRWTQDPQGNHYVLTVKTPKAEVGKIIDELIVRRPKGRR